MRPDSDRERGLSDYFKKTSFRQLSHTVLHLLVWVTTTLFEPPCEKTGLLGFRPGPTQTGLYSHRRWLEA